MDRRITSRRRLPGFFKVVMEPGIDHLSLPPVFVSKYHGNIPSRFVLVDKYARSWEVITGICEGGNHCFGKGWTDVVSAWEIQFQDFILFNPVSRSTIKFKVFSRNCCEKMLPQPEGTCVYSTSSSEPDTDDHHCVMSHWKTGGKKCITNAEKGKNRGKEPLVKTEVLSECGSDWIDEARMDTHNLEPKRTCNGKPEGSEMVPSKHRVNCRRSNREGMNRAAVEQMENGRRILGSFSVRATQHHVEKLVMTIPMELVRKLPNKTTVLKLLVPDSPKHWVCTYTIDKGSPRINMRGWRVVVKEASIQVGDILKFELVNNAPNCIEFMFYHNTTNPANI